MKTRELKRVQSERSRNQIQVTFSIWELSKNDATEKN